MSPSTAAEAAEKVDEEGVFTKGMEVEISLEEEGFRGSWYTATVLRPVSKRNNKLFVEFHNLMAEDKRGSRPLRESVDVVLARPVPPREKNGEFRFSDEVDAFHNDGWWEGVITDVLDGGDRFSVFFRGSREQIVFARSDLRVHREWVHGEWVPPFVEEAEEKEEVDDGAVVQVLVQGQGKEDPTPKSPVTKKMRV